MTPDLRRRRIQHAAASAPPLRPEVLAELRHLLPPVPAAGAARTSQLELAA